MPVSRHPEGTEEIPVPHTRFDWKKGAPSIHVEVRPGGWFSAPPAPVIDGWECHFVAHFGQEKTVYSYRPVVPA